MPKPPENPEVLAYMADPKYCSGCRYYGRGYNSGKNSLRVCDYTYSTGRLREGDTAHCMVRKEKERKKNARRL